MIASKRTRPSSPRGDASGPVHGKEALRASWAAGLERITEPRSELVDVRVGVHALVIDYRNRIGGRVCEVLTFRAGLVISGFGAYGDKLAH
ncbi:nuclear transport factor 2 family protein [Streptomyces sp. NPDC014685]|uniref:nuclear transport factor 2 family protein n=1 Tax=Streptomyces sp. NPDC014685 TaxID=3364881 RepID=UPI0036FA0FA3